MVSKKEIADAVAKFINKDLVHSIDDKQLKFVLHLIRQTLRENPDSLDSFMESPMIEAVIYEENGMYELNGFITMLKKILNEYESYPIAIPKVPLLLPHEKVIRITAEDIDKILNYLYEEEVVSEKTVETSEEIEKEIV